MAHVIILMNAIALRGGQVVLVIHASKHLVVFMGHVTCRMSAIVTLVGQEKTVMRVCHQLSIFTLKVLYKLDTKEMKSKMLLF